MLFNNAHEMSTTKKELKKKIKTKSCNFTRDEKRERHPA